MSYIFWWYCNFNNHMFLYFHSSSSSSLLGVCMPVCPCMPTRMHECVTVHVWSSVLSFHQGNTSTHGAISVAPYFCLIIWFWFPTSLLSCYSSFLNTGEQLLFCFPNSYYFLPSLHPLSPFFPVFLSFQNRFLLHSFRSEICAPPASASGSWEPWRLLP